VLAKSVTPSRILENKESLVVLDSEDMSILTTYSNQLEKEGKLTRYVYPAFGVDFGFPDKS
jgi:glycerol 2-dehydrogenase (NADP+)